MARKNKRSEGNRAHTKINRRIKSVPKIARSLPQRKTLNQ